MNNTEYFNRLDAALEELGYEPRTLRSGGHYSSDHPKTGERVFFPATPGDHRGLRNVLAELERKSGNRLNKQSGYRGGRRVQRHDRSFLHTRSSSEMEARHETDRARGVIAEIDTELSRLVRKSSHNPRKHRTRILELLTARKVHNNTLLHFSHAEIPCQINGLAALQSQWSSIPDDVPCTDEHVDMLKRAWGSR